MVPRWFAPQLTRLRHRMARAKSEWAANVCAKAGAHGAVVDRLGIRARAETHAVELRPRGSARVVLSLRRGGARSA